MSLVKEFKDFILRGNVVDLAVGVIIGAAFGKIVTSLVEDILMPPIGWILGGIDFSNYGYVIKEGSPEVKNAVGVVTQKAIPEVVWKYGNFIQILIVFLITAFCIFMVVKAMNMFMKKKDAAPAPPTKTEELLAEIRDELKKK